tara:strand:+ start:594 stop:1583 length:990 start_codon:yes stop_codon:yes gene_type:complete
MAKKKIHSSIKKTLGFDENMSDKEFKAAWKRKTSQVCKPCWELKYCPYGPFVEQSPLIGTNREDAVKHNEYLKNCLKTNLIGSITDLTQEQIEEKKEQLEILKEYPNFLLPEIYRELNDEERIKEGVEKNLKLFELYETPYDNFETYQVPFPLDENEEERKEKLLDEIMQIEITPDLQKRIDKKIKELEISITTEKDDSRRELDPLRKQYFEESVKDFNPDEYPEFIPKEVEEISCNIFGHICPVVFVGESITETSEKRRKGRYISFKTKIRVVRRDNHTCQECSKHLKDDEVEFDHIIPFSKGGSSEEHNIRLTCYDCNRDKTDKIKI